MWELQLDVRRLLREKTPSNPQILKTEGELILTEIIKRGGLVTVRQLLFNRKIEEMGKAKLRKRLDYLEKHGWIRKEPTQRKKGSKIRWVYSPNLWKIMPWLKPHVDQTAYIQLYKSVYDQIRSQILQSYIQQYLESQFQDSEVQASVQIKDALELD